MATRIGAARQKRKQAKNPPVTRYDLESTTPIHRQSLATTTPAPVMVENRQPGFTPHLRYAIPNQPLRSEPSLNRNKYEHKVQSDWMVPFCHHSPSDNETTFTGLFVPCALYGKTHLRLKNVSLGQDPHEIKTQNGCNSMCWIHGALTVACCLSVGLTFVQRARIRAQYRINGTVGDDVVKSLFCGPCAMMQHDREVRAREGDTRLAKDPGQYIAPLSQLQPRLAQPMRYPLARVTSAEHPGVENRIFRKEPSGKLQKRYTDCELLEVPAEAIPSGSQISSGKRSGQKLSELAAQNYEVEASRKHVRMQTNKNTIDVINAHPAIGKIDGAISSKSKPLVDSERNSLASFTNCVTLVDDFDSYTSSSLNEPNLKGCEKFSRIPARGHLSYVHDFSDCSATRVVLDHYAEEESDSQEGGTVRRHVHSGEEKAMKPGLNDIATRSIRSSGSSTIRQHSFHEAAAETLLSDFVNQDCIESRAAESVDSAWLLDIPVQHRISSCSIVPGNPSIIQQSMRKHRIASCPATPGTSTNGTSVSSVANDRMLSCTVETAPPSSSSFAVLKHDTPACIMDIMNESGFSTPLIQYSQYGHLLEEDAPESNPPNSGSPSKYRASSYSALSPVVVYGQQSFQGSAVSGDSVSLYVKKNRVSSCCASIPSSGTPNEGYASHTLKDCDFTTGSSTPITTKQHRLTSCPFDSASSSRRSSVANPGTGTYLMEDGCLLSGAASAIMQHRVASCRGMSSISNSTVKGGNSIAINNGFEDGCISSGSSTPKPRQHRAVSCIASSIITECEEHLLEDCEYDSKTASPLLQHDITGCDANSVSGDEQEHLLTVLEEELEEEQEHLLEDFVADSDPYTPLRQHRIASCVGSSPSSRNSVVEQYRIASCPGNIPDAGSRSQTISHDSQNLSSRIIVDASENDQSTNTHYEDCLHTLDECITPVDRVKMEANASRDTEHEKYSMRITSCFNDSSTEYNEKFIKGKEIQRPKLNDMASHESNNRSTLAQLLSLEGENNFIYVAEIDGDGTMSIASRSSAAPLAPIPSPATPASSTPIEHLNIIGAYPSSITPLNIKKDRKRIPSEHSSAGSSFASYFGFGSSKKSQGLGGDGSVGVIGTGSVAKRGNRSSRRSLGLVMVEPVPVEELELKEIWF